MDNLERFAQSYLDGLVTNDEFLMNVINYLSYFIEESERGQSLALAFANRLTKKDSQ